jgi:hypothetical protein
VNVIFGGAATRAAPTVLFQKLALGTSMRGAIRAIRERLPEV